MRKLILGIALLLGTAWSAAAQSTGTDKNGLQTLSSCPVFAPTAFTPNGDGKNDYFGVRINPDCNPVEFNLRVFDRWGRLLFESKSPLETFWWDGTYEGNELKDGVYIWKLQARYEKPNSAETVELNEKGTVVLIR